MVLSFCHRVTKQTTTIWTVDLSHRSFILCEYFFKNSSSPSDKSRGWKQLKHSEAVWIGVCLRRCLLKSGRWLLSLWRGGLISHRFCAGSALQMDCWKARRLFVCPFPRVSICGCSPASRPLPGHHCYLSSIPPFTCNATTNSPSWPAVGVFTVCNGILKTFLLLMRCPWSVIV